jgi:hypothetical protein
MLGGIDPKDVQIVQTTAQTSTQPAAGATGQAPTGTQPMKEKEGDYSAKKARAGKDIGKPGKQFSKIATSAGKRYGSKAAGERVAGAVLKNLRKANEGVSEASKKIPASNKPVDPKDALVSLKDVPAKKPRGHTQYDPSKEFPGVKVFKKQGVAEAAKYRDPKYLGKLHAPDAERQEREREEDDAFNAWVNSTDDFIDPVFQPDIRSHDEKVPLNRQGKPYEKDPLASRKDVRGRKDKTGVKRPFKADLKAAIRQGLGKHNLKGVLPEQGVAEGKEDLASLRAKAKEISDKIDAIVKDGGRVGFNDPLSRQLKAIRAKIQQAKKQGVAEGSSIALKKKLSVTENSFADEFTKFAKGFGKERGINVRTGKPGERTPGPVAANPTLSGSDPENRERLMARYKELKAQFDPAYEYSDDYGFWNKQRAIRDEMQAIKQQLGSDVTESKRNK